MTQVSADLAEMLKEGPIEVVATLGHWEEKLNASSGRKIVSARFPDFDVRGLGLEDGLASQVGDVRQVPALRYLVGDLKVEDQGVRRQVQTSPDRPLHAADSAFP